MEGGPRDRRGPAPALPSLDALRRYLRSAPGRVGKTEISRHFGLGTEQRPALRALLRELEREGALDRATVQRAGHDGLPEMLAVEVSGIDPDGEPLARPLDWEPEAGRPPLIVMRPERRGQPALMPGERVVARLRPIGGGRYEGRTFRRLGFATARRILGLYREGQLLPTDRRQKAGWTIAPEDAAGAAEDELVLAEPLPAGRAGLRPARVVERLGPLQAPGAISLLCIHRHSLPCEFPEVALAEAAAAGPVGLTGREDLRGLELVTIDGADARDFDDAVWAEAEPDGWRVVVAIADVAHYVRPDSTLDEAARLRGNSVYFPDRVVPMLPEALSNGWCSLRPGEDRGCLFVEMHFNGEGAKRAHRFGRGLMRSAARLTYDEVEALEGEAIGRLRPRIDALRGAHAALRLARERRGTLDLDLPEHRVRLSEDGQVLDVSPRPRLEAHRLIEDVMIAANVCAAEELERLGQSGLYRVHDRPSDSRLEGLRQLLAALALDLPATPGLRARDFAALLEAAKGDATESLVHQAVLRSQSQAAYDTTNIGHFGLSLGRYAHFTSPIRRYADLLVHRALIRGLRLGPDGLREAEAGALQDTAERITAAERRAAAAEREAVERYLASHMASRVGDMFEAWISGVTRFGLFVTVKGNGASGLVPLSSLPDDQWTHTEAAHRLSGRFTRLSFALGQPVSLRLAEAMPLTGGLVFHLAQAPLPSPGARRSRLRSGGTGKQRGARPA
ncbi:ribonuclease R family protein [Pseudoroseomonas sp. WGS1072]|uniref:ribonuclease R family protein n=1 Tax=Roseomonas sp. WGS1072 TaxID=3366816 RepID=UPI003BF15746